MVRYFVYFGIWLLLVGLLNKWSREQDQTGNPELADRMNAISGPGLVFWGFAVSGAAVDWVMSLEPHWFSTIYGLLFIAIEALIALSFTLFMLRMLSDFPPIKDSVAPSRFNDLGNILLAFVMLWAYLSFDQLLIIWAGNLKEEIPWYHAARLRRMGAGRSCSGGAAFLRAFSAVIAARREAPVASAFDRGGLDGCAHPGGYLLDCCPVLGKGGAARPLHRYFCGASELAGCGLRHLPGS